MNTHKFLKIFSVLAVLTEAMLPVRAQQNIQFTQYIFNALSINPAYAGYKEQWFGQMALRTQWTGIDDAPKTGQASFDGILDAERKRMGLGLQLTADKLGPQSANSAYLNYAYRLQLNAEDTERLSFGIAAGVTQYSLNYNKFTATDLSDEHLSGSSRDNLVPDLRFGIYYYNPKLYIGLSMLDLLSREAASVDISSNRYLAHTQHLYLMSGLLLNLNTDVKLRPSFLLKEDFKGPSSIDLNSMVIFKDKIWLGASYRTAISLWKKAYDSSNVSRLNSISALAQLYLNQDLRLGYSYDYSLNQLSNIENGSHEITLGFTLPSKYNRVITPRFF